MFNILPTIGLGPHRAVHRHTPLTKAMLTALRILLTKWLQSALKAIEIDAPEPPPIPEFLLAHPDETPLSRSGRGVGGEEGTAVPYDENLLERARTQWQFGDWESLAKIERDTLQHHPDRAKLALLAAAGRLQTDNASQARQFIRLAQNWGVSKKLVSQILIAGVHNSIGRAAAISNQQARALQHFEDAIAIGTPGSDTKLLTQARINEQNKQIECCLLKCATQTAQSLLSRKSAEIYPSTLRKSEGSVTVKIDREVVDRESKKIPPEDLVNAVFDLREQSRTTHILIIFSTPRCGSTLFCDILQRNNICVAHEYFQPYQYMPILAERWGCIDQDFLDPAGYVSELCRYRTLPNGWLGINLHSSHISIFDRMLQQFPEAMFIYIHLMRRDTLSQAISYAIARQTDQWSSRFESVAEAKYDFKMIRNLYNSIVEGNAFVDAYVSRHNLACNKFYFEDLTENPGEFFRNISKVIPDAGSIEFTTALNRQATDVNRKWEIKYKEDLCMSMQNKKTGSIEFNQ